MGVIDNPNVESYDDKEPTNIRLIKEVKDALKEEADKKGVTMSDIINEELAERYKL